MKRIFCNVPMKQLGTMNNGLRQWPRGYIVTWNVVQPVPGFGIQTCQQIYQGAWDMWSAISGWRHRYTSNPRNANVLIGTRAIDTKGQALAEAQLPWIGITKDTQLQVWFDRNDDWTDSKNWQGSGRFPIPTVALHEFGHTKGHGHNEDGIINSIMDPAISHIIDLQAWEIEQDVLRYGPPEAKDQDEDQDDDILLTISRCLQSLTREQRTVVEQLFLP